MAESLSSLGAVASGIDYRALVDQIIRSERRPADRMQATIDGNTKRTASLNQFQALLGTLRSSAEALKDGTPFDAFSSSVQGTDARGRTLVSATTNADAVPGSYTIEVRALTSTQKNVGSVGHGTAALALTGTFSLAGASGTESFTLDGTETLGGVRDRINAATARTGVQASIVNGGEGDQRLVLTSTRAGVAGRFTVADVDPLEESPSLVAALGIGAATVPGNDAELVIDGAITVRRSTNVVADVIPGVTLTLQQAEIGTRATLEVSRVKSTASEGLKGFVDAYNAVQGFIAKQTGKGGALANDSFTRGFRGELSRLVGAAGAAELPAEMRSLAAVGLSLQKDGTLTIDPARFDAAYGGQLDDARRLLADRMAAFSTFIDPFSRTGGSIDTREAGIDITNALLGKRIEDVDARLEKKRAAMLAQWSKFEGTLGRLNALGSQMSAQLNGLVKSSRD